MRHIIGLLIVLWVSVSLASPSANADLDDASFGRWELRTSNCGRWYQMYLVYDLHHLLGEWPQEIWQAAREEGADDHQIGHLKREFEIGREWAREAGWREDKDPIQWSLITDGLKEEVKKRISYCLNQERK